MPDFKVGDTVMLQSEEMTFQERRNVEDYGFDFARKYKIAEVRGTGTRAHTVGLLAWNEKAKKWNKLGFIPHRMVHDPAPHNLLPEDTFTPDELERARSIMEG